MEEYLNQKLIEFRDFYKNSDFDGAITLCESVINDSKLALSSRELNSETENNMRYLAGITFKGFLEFIQLYRLTHRQAWYDDNKNVERIWYLLCDCVDHLNCSAGMMESLPLDNILKRLQGFNEVFSAIYGPGLYASPVIIINKEICSICKEDVRGCLHRQGQLYNGMLCKHIAESISDMKSIDLVRVPKDPRCRVWPWNEKEKGVYEMRFLSISSPDDFLYE